MLPAQTARVTRFHFRRKPRGLVSKFLNRLLSAYLCYLRYFCHPWSVPPRLKVQRVCAKVTCSNYKRTLKCLPCFPRKPPELRALMQTQAARLSFQVLESSLAGLPVLFSIFSAALVWASKAQSSEGLCESYTLQCQAYVKMLIVFPPQTARVTRSHFRRKPRGLVSRFLNRLLPAYLCNFRYF